MFPVWFRVYLFLCGLIIPVTMLILGIVYIKHPPRRVGGSGFKTSLSVRNTDTWLFAQVCWGRVCLRWGTVLLILSAAVIALLFHRGVHPGAIAGVAALVQTIVWLLTYFPVTRALGRRFYPNGMRK